MTGPSARLTVIIPALNEQARIGERLRELRTLRGVSEVIVVDGGSTDATCEIVRRFPEARLLQAPRGRARQMNHGAAAAGGDVLLFLHADVSLPDDAAVRVSETLAKPGIVAGAFKTWTVSDAGESRLEPLLHLADVRSRYSHLPYGDQALFMRKEIFVRVGGYPAQELMEDLELSLRLSRLGRIVTVPASVRVSGRRFVAHPIRDTLLVNVFPLLYRIGVSPRRLAALYRDTR